MSCELSDTTLGKWYDGELAVDQGRRVAEHVDGCAQCRRQVTAWRQIDELLTCEVPAPELGGQVARALRRERVPQPLWWLKMAAAALVAAGLGAVGAQLSFPTHQQTMLADQSFASLAVLDEHFGPGSLAGIDDLAGDTALASGELP